VQCRAGNGLKFSTRVGLPASPWIVSVPPVPADELDFTSEPPQAAVPNSATAVAAAHNNIGVRRFMVSPRVSVRLIRRPLLRRPGSRPDGAQPDARHAGMGSG